ncbi:Protein scarlet [Gryllus bimaculatus]|nr:Protein scarlet [Gryllus bimaculatus]
MAALANSLIPTLRTDSINVWVVRLYLPSWYIECSLKGFREFKSADAAVHGRAESGSLVAVMGASGSGKTTLLNAVSKRVEDGVEGGIFLNSQIVCRNELIEVSGFVTQKDIAITTLTAMEHSFFMSQMRLNKSIKSNQRRTRISELLTELGLSGQEDTQLKYLSGGERKRLSVAVELLHDPLILFCDEPTTGLDSYNALLLIEKLQIIAKAGKIVMCSIHQPASDIFTCFNQIILLTNGKLAYHGPTNHVLTYFSSLGSPCPSNYNPADFLITKFAIVPGDEDSCTASNEYFCQKFAESHLGESLRCNEDDRINQVTSLMLAIFYSNIFTHTQQGIQDVHGLLYLISSEVYFTSTYRVLNTFPQEISVFTKEKDLYPTSAYYIAKIITTIPRTVIEPAIYLAIICIVQYLCGCPVLSYFTLLGPLLISACSASAYGCALSAVFQSPNIASVISVPVDLATMLMAGMFFNIRSLPSVISWIKYLSQLHYTNEVLLVLHWQNIDYIDCPEDKSLPCLRNGTQVLQAYGYSPGNVSGDLIALVLIFFILNVIGCLGLWRQARKNTFK